MESDGFRLRPVHPASSLTSKEGLLICTSELPPAARDIGGFLDKEREQRSRQVGGMGTRRKACFDTSALVAARLQWHRHHLQALPQKLLAVHQEKLLGVLHGDHQRRFSFQASPSPASLGVMIPRRNLVTFLGWLPLPLRRSIGLLATLYRLAVTTAGAEPSLRIDRLLGPEVPTGNYKHPASFTELSDGSLYVVFFSGKGEYHDNAAAVYGTRLRKDGAKPSKPVAIATNPFHSLGNAVVWEAPDRTVWLFYVTRYGEVWADSRITAKISRDGALTWSEPFQVTFEAGTMVRSRPVVLADDSWILPAYSEIGRDPEFDDGTNTSLFLRFDPKKGVWSESNRVRSRLGNIQPAAAVVDGDHLVAFCRRGGDYKGRPDGWMVRTESRNGGRTWSEGKESEFPNPNAAVDFLRLANGHHLLVFNHSFTNRTPLTVAVSTDGAKSFPHARNLLDAPDGDYGYPTALQTRDGRVHVLFTSDERTVVRHAVFPEEWVRSGKGSLPAPVGKP